MSEQGKQRWRLAPTPSGYLHIGNVYNLLLNWLWARANGGGVFLRLDDLDAGRIRSQYVEDIFRVLDFLGLDWDLGPTGPDDFAQNWSQQLRLDAYESLLCRLREKDCVFACTCSRSQLEGTGGLYPGYCERLGLDLDSPDCSWRLRITHTEDIRFQDRLLGEVALNPAEAFGSFVVKRRDGLAAYQLASLADDMQYGISHIARGMDLLPATGMQLYLSETLGLPNFHNTVFLHHDLLLEQGRKLSKSAGSQSVSLLQSHDASSLFQGFANWWGYTDFESHGGLAGLLDIARQDQRLR
ncbi:MAG: hypothetical protein JNL57_12485 [Bacteroidetes bacterium]|nr:hypothetical protein [Bacteroidota bacterium]